MDSLQLTGGEGLGGTGGRQRGWSPTGGIALRLRPAEGWAEPRLMAAQREGRSWQLAGRTPCASREAGAAGLGPSARSGDSVSLPKPCTELGGDAAAVPGRPGSASRHGIV